MILITGATGELGRKVSQALSPSGVPLRLMVRDTSKPLPELKADVVRGDYTDPESLRAAFDGVQRAFIVSGHARPMDRAKLHCNAFRAAAHAGVEYIVYTSFQGAGENATFSMARDHQQSEIYLRKTGVHHTALRNGFYAESAHEEVGKDGTIRNPIGDGRVAWVSRDDIAELAAHFLLNPDTQNAAYDVTGPEAPKMSELAALLSELTGVDITFQCESYDQGLAWRKTYGLVEWNLEAWMTSDMAKGRGENANVSDTIPRFLGRKALTLRELYTRYPAYVERLRTALRMA